MRRLIPLILATTLFAALPAAAQNVAEIPFDSVSSPLTLPDDIYLGEIGGVAANSKGDVFVYTRTGIPLFHSEVLARSRTAVQGCSNSTKPANSFARSERTVTVSCLRSRFALIHRTISGLSNWNS